MVPLLFRYRLQMERAIGAPHTTGTTADALVSIIYGLLAIRGLLKGMCKNLAPPDALTAGMTFRIVFDSAVVRSLDRFLNRVVQEGCIQ